MKRSGILLLAICSSLGCASKPNYVPSRADPTRVIREMTPEDLADVSFEWAVSDVISRFGEGDNVGDFTSAYPIKGEVEQYVFCFYHEPEDWPLWAIVQSNPRGMPGNGRVVWPPKWAGRKLDKLLPPFEERK